MRIKGSAIVVGGTVLSSFLLLLLIQIVLAAGQPPTTPHTFLGEVTGGGVPAEDGLEIRVKAFDAGLGRLVPIRLTSNSLDETDRHLTKNGTYGDVEVGVPADVPETLDVREGAKPGESLHFFVVTDADRDLEVPARLFVVDRGEFVESVPYDPGQGTDLDLSIIPPPEPIAPTGVIADDTPLFTWTPSASTGVLNYRLQVVRSGNGFEGPFVINAPDLTQTQFPTPTPLDDANYDWRVIATDNQEHEATSFVESFTVQTVPPEQVRNLDPKNFINDPTPTFEFGRPRTLPSEGLGTYEVAISPRDPPRAAPAGQADFVFEDADFIDFKDQDAFVAECFAGGAPVDCGPATIADADTIQLTLVNPLADGEYVIGIRTVDLLGAPGVPSTTDFSVDSTFVAVPTLLEPLNGATFEETPPLFKWTAITVPKDATYILEIGEGADFTNLAIPRIAGITDQDPTTTGDVEFTLPDELQFGDYVWRVAAVDEVQNTGGFSDPFEFTIRKIELSPPTQLRLDPDLEFIKDSTPEFTWAPPQTGDPVSYQLQVVQLGRPFQAPFFLNVTLSSPGEGIPPATEYQTKPTEALADTRYEWRVIATDAAVPTPNVKTSEVAAFTLDTLAPTEPGLPRDVTAAADARVRTFEWTPSTDPVPDPPGAAGDESGVNLYRILILGVQNLVFTRSTGEICSGDLCTFTTPDPLDIGSYTISVAAEDRATNRGDATDPVTFRAGPATAVQDLTQLDAFPVNEPTFEWKPPLDLPEPGAADGGIRTYEVAITGDGSVIPPYNILFTPFTDTDLFIVKCLDEAGSETDCSKSRDVDRVQLTVRGPVPFTKDGVHTLLVRPVDKGGTPAPVNVREFKVEPVVDMRLISEREFVGPGDTFNVDIVVEPNGQPLSVVDAVLAVPPNLEVVRITPGATLSVELNNAIDGAAGRAAYSAATFEEPVRNRFTLAVVTFRAKEARDLRDRTVIDFVDRHEFPTLVRATYKGVSVLDELVRTEVTVLRPTVDLLLGLETEDRGLVFGNFEADEFDFARRQEIVVVVRVDTHGQFVSSVDALLDFDSDTLEVEEVVPAEGILLEHVIINDRTGTIDLSAFTTGPALNTGFSVAESFDLARITLRHKRAARGLSVGFSERFPRKSEAFYREVSVLNDLKGFPVELALELRLNTFDGPAFEADVVVQARLNGNRASAVDVLLESSGDLEMNGIARAPGSKLGTVLSSTVDPAAGTAEYGATIRLVPPFGVPPLGEFDLAILDVTAGRIAVGDDPSTDEITFQTEFPRSTNVALNGTPIPVDRLKPVRMEARPPGRLPNLRRTTSNFDPTPTFQWDPPVRRPAAGIRTFEVSIVGAGPQAGATNIEGDASLIRS